MSVLGTSTLLVALFLPTVTSTSLAKMAPRDTTGQAAMSGVLDRPDVRWDPSKVSSELRGRFHLSSDLVPVPHEDPMLMHPHSWPKVKVIDGVTCILRVSTGANDAVWTVSSLEEVKPGASFGLFYVRLGDKDWPPRGPTYAFLPDSTLQERFWTFVENENVETQEYVYYPSGKLFNFIRRESGPQAKSFEWLDEVFARDGELVGWGFARGGEGKHPTSAGYWLGEEVGSKEYRLRRATAASVAFAQDR